MTIRYLLDTNVISEPLRPVPNPQVLTRLYDHRAEIAIASVVWHELWYGCCRLPASAKRTVIERYLRDVVASTIPVLAYDQQAGEWHAEQRARLQQMGRPAPFADGQIAAIAATNDLVLVTFNGDHFTVFDGLHIEDWSSA